MIVVRQLVWDSWNTAHIALHEVTPDEVEEVCHGNSMTSATYAGRLRVIGSTAQGRMLTTILAPHGEPGDYYPVTARPASKKERSHYSETAGGESP